MANALGAGGLSRREFEQSFIRYCADNSFEPGYECARLMDKSSKAGDARTFAALLGVASKTLTTIQPGENTGQQSLLIEWRGDGTVDEPQPADAA